MVARKKKENEEMNMDAFMDEEETESEEVGPVEAEPAEPDMTKGLNDSDIATVMTEMISRPKPRGSIPTFVTFRENGQVPERHVILDIPEPFLKEAWVFYRDNKDKPTAEDFLIMVYDIMKMGIPRLYRKVAKLSLE